LAKERIGGFDCFCAAHQYPFARLEVIHHHVCSQTDVEDCGERGEERQCDDVSSHGVVFGLVHVERTMTATATASMAVIVTMVEPQTLTIIIATIAMIIWMCESCSPAQFFFEYNTI